MSRREDFKKILNHQQPECLTVDFGGNPLSSMEGRSMQNLLDFLGFDNSDKNKDELFGSTQRIDERILRYFDTDTRAVGTILAPKNSLYKSISPTKYIDEWGITRTFTGLYWDIVEYPLKDAEVLDLEKYQWPNPDYIDEAQLELFAKQAKYLYENTDYVICAEHPVFGIFELGCWMCGFDDFMMKMAADEEFVHRFFEIVLNYQKKVIERYYGAVGQYVHYTSSGDDFATQSSLFVSPDMFREFIKPYFKERISFTKKFTKAAYLHHSCGSVYPIIPDLIDCGVQILNPIQPKANDMQPEKLKKAYGDKIVFHGGLDTQDVLPFGTKESIEQAVKETIASLNINGGYVFAAAHNIQEDVPPQNIVYMLEAAKKYGHTI